MTADRRRDTQTKEELAAAREKNISHPDEIRTTEISSRLNKGNKDLTGQVGQADTHRMTQTTKRSWEIARIGRCESGKVRRAEGRMRNAELKGKEFE